MSPQPSTAQIKAEVLRLRKIKKGLNLEEITLKKKEERMRLRERKERIIRAKLTQELVDLQNPRSTAFKKNIKRAGRGIIKTIFLIGEDVDKRLRVKKKR